MARRTGYALSAILAIFFVLAAVGAQAESHVRIIRLSYVDGAVQMDRATGPGLERAILNTPVTEGLRLVTGNDGLAEVEFENNSTVRLGENSEIRFTKLVVNDAGAKVNEVELVKGTAYFDTKGSKDDIYRATVGDATFLVHRDSQVRLSDDTGNPKVSVLKGEAELESQSHDVKVGKKETLTVEPNSASGYEIAKGIDAGPLDRWNDERSAYQTAYSYNNTGVGSSLNAYGYSDLNYYGGWSNIPGIGYGWQPYGVSNWIGWNPYLAGAWSFAPGLGYSWASAYPWGWLPYHYGSWSYIGGGGWFWVPGNFYRNNGWYANGFQSVPVVHGPAGWQAPTQPPITGASSFAPTVKVGTIGNMPAAIPGGRMPPNFRSVVPGYGVADRAAYVPRTAAQTYVRPAASQHNVQSTARPVYGPFAGGHVFATPSRPSSVAHGAESWGGGGWGSETGMSPASASHSTGSLGATHGGVGASHASSGHGSPR
jgi:FecR protein